MLTWRAGFAELEYQEKLKYAESIRTKLGCPENVIEYFCNTYADYVITSTRHTSDATLEQDAVRLLTMVRPQQPWLRLVGLCAIVVLMCMLIQRLGVLSQ